MIHRMHGAARGWRILFAIVGWAPGAVNFSALLAFFLVPGLIVAAIDRGLSALGKGDSSLAPS